MKSCYQQLSLLYKKHKKAVSEYWWWTDKEKVNASDKPRERKNVESLASAFTTWIAVLLDTGFPKTWAAHWVGTVEDLYCEHLEDLFKALKGITGLVRSCATQDRILDTFLEKGYHAVLLEPLCYRPDWRDAPDSFKAVHACYCFLARVYADRDALTRDALSGFEERCTGEIPDMSKCGQVIGAMRFYITRWMRDWDPKDIKKGLSFSSGTTRDCGRDLAAKVQMLDHLPPSISEAIRVSGDESLYVYLPEEDFEDCTLDGKCFERYLKRNKASAVPKSALSKRLIAEENAVCNFFQKGLDYSIRECNSFPRWAIRFNDQSYARKQAWRGSADGSFSTVDFSAASDSIWNAEVDELFSEVLSHPDENVQLNPTLQSEDIWPFKPEKAKGVPLLALWLQAVRSPETEYKFPKDTAITISDLVVYASMGNVNCFTILSLTVLALAYVACDYTGCSKEGISVYGDDLVIPTEAIPVLYELASLIGLKVNVDKSYSTGWFREACGIFAFKGVDVTVPQYPRQFVNLFEPSEFVVNPDHWELDYVWATAVNSVGNEFFLADMPISRQICYQALVSAGLTFVTGNPMLWTPEFANPTRKVTKEREWLYVPQTPLYAYSQSERVCVVSSSRCSDQLEEVSKIEFTHACPCVQFEQKKGLPTPHRLKPRVKTEVRGKGFNGLTYGEPEVFREYDGAERLRIWLYMAECSVRQNLFEAEGFPDLTLPLRVPSAVYTGHMLCVTKDALLTL